MVLIGKLNHRVVQQRISPPGVKDFLRGQVVRRLEPITILRTLRIEVDESLLAASFQAMSRARFHRKIVLKGRKQK